VLASLRACGVGDVVMMPENGGIGRHIDRGLARARNLGEQQFPKVHYLPMRVGGTVDDTHRATKAMVRAGVVAIVVLGGDGTQRAVAAASRMKSGSAWSWCCMIGSYIRVARRSTPERIRKGSRCSPVIQMTTAIGDNPGLAFA
jgi:hypothetical protein